MDRHTSSFETDMRVSPKLVTALMWGLACALLIVAEYQADTAKWWSLSNVALALALLSVAIWALDAWKPWIGRWFTIAVLVTTILLTHSVLQVPGFLTLLVVPAALATVLIGLPAAAIIAGGISLLLVALLQVPPARLDVSAVAVTLTAIWAVLAIIYATHRRMQRLSGWLEEYFERAQRSVQEARDRRAEQEQAVDNLTHANRQLALMSERLTTLRLIAEEAQRSKTRFVARVSHEFRTPLNMIIGLVELMIDAPEMYDVALSPRMRKDLEVVHRNCEHLSDMINDVLDLTRIEADRVVLYRERVGPCWKENV